MARQAGYLALAISYLLLQPGSGSSVEPQKLPAYSKIHVLFIIEMREK